MKPKFPLEDIRSFFVKRSWLIKQRSVTGEVGGVITLAEYSTLKHRSGMRFRKNRIEYLRAFIDGWIHAKA